MTRNEAIHWLHEHPSAVHGDVDEVLRAAERDVREHAALDIWLSAKALAEEQAQEWSRHHGYHAAEDSVAREVCPELARALREHWRSPEALSTGFRLAERLLQDVEPAALEALRDFAQAVAREERSHTLAEVVKFTRHRARTLIREGKLSPERAWEKLHGYPEAAAKVLELLAQDFEAHVHLSKS